MPRINQTRQLPYTCTQLYTVVNDIERYVEFLPYCEASQELYRDEHSVKATLVMGMSGVQKSFTTHHDMQENRCIEMHLFGGPFSSFEGCWCFEPIDSGCEVSLELQFEFTSTLLASLLKPMLNAITVQLLDAFCQRAEALYS